MLCHDYSSYCWLYVCAITVSRYSSNAISDWSVAFPVPKMFISGGPVRFQNEFLRVGCKGHQVTHYLMHPYCGCGSKGVERFCKNLFRFLHGVFSETILIRMNCRTLFQLEKVHCRMLHLHREVALPRLQLSRKWLPWVQSTQSLVLLNRPQCQWRW